MRISPERGNVVFASTQMGWSFTLQSFAQLYSDTYGAVDVDAFAMRLWGNIYYNEETRKFSRNPTDAETKRSFVHFILEPLYKLYSQVSLSRQTTKEVPLDNPLFRAIRF
jgi:U5 small nuclear ribonucleoprotein component